MTAAPARSQNEQKDQRVVDDFISTRGVDFVLLEQPSRPKKKKRPVAARASKGAQGASKKSEPLQKPDKVSKPSDADEEPDAEAVATSAPASLSPLGLGYTILSLNRETKDFVAVEPGHVFREGDELRLMLETNANGYLYVFNTENKGQPVMLYPNVTLDGGSNKISGHTSEFYPAEQSFEIVEKAAIEHLYVIFSRNPLPDVPTGGELEKFCSPKIEACDWSPTQAQWEKITSLAAGTQVDKGMISEQARAEIRVASSAITRRIRIKPKAPSPAVVCMNASAKADVLLTKIELIHK
jgi:hypothetical protein